MDDSLVGRTNDLARLSALLSDGARLVTLTGAGGIGKTRLATELVRRLDAKGLPAIACDLSGVTGMAAAHEIIASRLAEYDGKGPVGDLAERLVTLGPVLLLLDDFDALVADSEEIAPWLAAADELVILLTSREITRLAGEQVYEVGPLELPGNVRELEQSPAGALLIACARRHQHDWNPSSEERAALVALLAMLEGIPLAIQLAASRLNVLSPAELLARIENRFQLLARGTGSSPLHHRTMEACVEWSSSHLSDAERATLAQCAVFEGGFSPDAAERIVDAPVSVLDQLQALREKSLLRADSNRDGAQRLSMLMVIRDYARRHLARLGLETSTRTRHARWFADWGWERVRAYRKDFSLVTLTELRLRWPDSLTALVFSIRHGAEATVTARLALASELVVFAAGPEGEQLERLRAALETLDEIDDDETRACALLLRAKLGARYFGDGSPLDDLRRAAEVGSGCNAHELSARAHQMLSSRHRFVGELDVAKRHIDAARQAASRAQESPSLLAALEWEAGSVARGQGRLVAARKLYESSVERCRDTDSEQLPQALYGLGNCLLDLGQHEPAERLLHEALAEARRCGMAEGQLFILSNLGLLHHDAGRLDDAEEFLRAAAEIGTALEVRLGLAQVAGQRGMLELERGRSVRARALLQRAYEGVAGRGYVEHRVSFAAGLAAAKVLEGHVDEADLLLEEAAGLAAGNEELTAIAAAFEAHVLVSRARAARERGDHKDAASLIGRAAESVESRVIATPGASPLECFAPVRVALRSVRPALTSEPPVGRLLADAALAQAGTSIPRTLTIDEAKVRFRPPFGDWVDCRRRGALWLVLLALTERHQDSPDQGIGRDELVARGWPNERMSPESAKNRLHVKVSTLRRLGLHHVLVTRGRTYLLDPELCVLALGA